MKLIRTKLCEEDLPEEMKNPVEVPGKQAVIKWLWSRVCCDKVVFDNEYAGIKWFMIMSILG